MGNVASQKAGNCWSGVLLKRFSAVVFVSMCACAGAQSISAQNQPDTISSDHASSTSSLEPAANTASAPAKTSAPLPAGAIELDPDDSTSPKNGTADAQPDPTVQPSHAAIQPLEDDTALVDPASLLPDLPPVPPGNAALIGGTLDRLDRVRDRMTVRPFGGGKMVIAFDPRTKIYRGTELVSSSDLRKGDRIYVDTILDGSTVFAKNIRLKASISAAGDGQGTILNYRAGKHELIIRDSLSPQPLHVLVTPQTRYVQRSQAVSEAQLIPGTLVSVKFAPRQSGLDVAQEINILAVPGSHFTFAGRVEALDLRLGLLVLTSTTDRKTYEIHLDPSLVDAEDTLRPGVEVTAETSFDGRGYVARSVSVNPTSNPR